MTTHVAFQRRLQFNTALKHYDKSSEVFSCWGGEHNYTKSPPCPDFSQL